MPDKRARKVIAGDAHIKAAPIQEEELPSTIEITREEAIIGPSIPVEMIEHPPITHQSHSPLTEEEMHNLKARLENLERRVEVLEAQEATEPWHSGNGQPGTLDFISQMEGSPGIVVDAGVARATPCSCFSIKDSELCFSKGVVGALDEEQKTLYCPEKIMKEPTPEQKKRLAGFQTAVGICKEEITAVPKGEQLSPWLNCMSRELKAQGIEL